MTIKGFIFDLDGTIGNTLPLCIAAFQKAFEPLTGRQVSAEEIVATFGPSEEATVQTLVPAEQYDEGLHGYWRWYETLHDMCPEPFAGMRDVLDRIRGSGAYLAMATGKAKTSADISIRRFGLEDYFSDCEYGWIHGPRKPAAIRALLEKSGLKRDEVTYIGDAPSDVDACREAGVPIIAAAWAETAEPERLALLKPEKLFRSVGELAEYVDAALKGEKA